MPEAVLEDVLSGLDFDIACESGHGGDRPDEHPATFISYWTCGCPMFLCSTACIRMLNEPEGFRCDDCGSEETHLVDYEPLRKPK